MGMLEMPEMQFNATTNLEGGKNERKKVRPCFICCLVTFLIDSDWLLIPLESLLAHATRTTLEAPHCGLLDRHHKGLEQCLVPRDGDAGKIQDNDG